MATQTTRIVHESTQHFPISQWTRAAAGFFCQDRLWIKGYIDFFCFFLFNFRKNANNSVSSCVRERSVVGSILLSLLPLSMGSMVHWFFFDLWRMMMYVVLAAKFSSNQILVKRGRGTYERRMLETRFYEWSLYPTIRLFFFSFFLFFFFFWHAD